jgi:hypothetical protein
MEEEGGGSELLGVAGGPAEVAKKSLVDGQSTETHFLTGLISPLAQKSRTFEI